jgi:probable F420-dependent oxidoreductase
MTQPQATTDRSRGFGKVGIWSLESRFGDPAQAKDAAIEAEALGYGAIWIPGGIGGDVLGDIERLLLATQKIKYATAILNIYRQDAGYVGNWWNAKSAAVHARIMLGIGVSHGPLIGEEYRKPLGAMSDYLDALDKAGVPAASRCLAALGPKMLELARDRSAGAHPYLVSPEHTAEARAILGPDAFLAPELGVAVETDPAKARELARAALAQYLVLPNYVNNWRRLGFSEAEISGSSDRLVDSLFAWGSVEKIAARVKEFHDAGADHVCLQVLHAGAATMTPPLAQWRALAPALL